MRRKSESSVDGKSGAGTPVSAWTIGARVRRIAESLAAKAGLGLFFWRRSKRLDEGLVRLDMPLGFGVLLGRGMVGRSCCDVRVEMYTLFSLSFFARLKVTGIY